LKHYQPNRHAEEQLGLPSKAPVRLPEGQIGDNFKAEQLQPPEVRRHQFPQTDPAQEDSANERDAGPRDPRLAEGAGEEAHLRAAQQLPAQTVPDADSEEAGGVCQAVGLELK